MKCHWVALGSLLACTLPVMADELRSGPPAGARVPVPFHALVTLHAEKPDAAGKKWDFHEQYGQDPVVLVFARTGSARLAKFLQGIDAEVARYKGDHKKVHAVLVSGQNHRVRTSTESTGVTA